MKNVYYFPQKNLLISLPFVLVFAVVVGFFINTSWMAGTILIATMLMIYPTMIGIQLKALLNLTEKKLISFAMIINFIIIPLLAYSLGSIFLKDEPVLFAALVLIALLPTSGMTISWTAISDGNVSAAIKLTIFGLISGAVLAPFYLHLLMGEIINIEILSIMRTILMVVFIPLIAGVLTTFFIRQRFGAEVIPTKVKPVMQPISLWAMLYIIFASISMRAQLIIENWQMIGLSLLVLLIFYIVSFAIVTWLAKRFFSRDDGLSLIYGATLRNVSIAIGIGVTAFGMEAALLMTIAFMVQQQGIVLYNRYVVPIYFPRKKVKAVQQF